MTRKTTLPLSRAALQAARDLLAELPVVSVRQRLYIERAEVIAALDALLAPAGLEPVKEETDDRGDADVAGGAGAPAGDAAARGRSE